MRYLFFFFLCSVGLPAAVAQGKKKDPPPVKYWEELHDTSRAALKNSPRVNKFALLYLEGKFIPANDSVTRRMLLDITMPTEDGLPLNFMVFNTIVKKQEDQLNPMMGEFCRRMILSHPDYTLHWLFNQMQKKNDTWKLYAKYIGEQSSPIEYQNFVNFLTFYYGSGGKAAAKQMNDLILKESKKHRK
ncbi:MAG: hypothetical protein IT233_04125 [Bacteroidia bacterium]|nr:hypothetical protein [Bacteroidia bacterium]